ncbi:hypothetical protein BH09VER1_BH09VER1_25160 [soil metagenome]
MSRFRFSKITLSAESKPSKSLPFSPLNSTSNLSFARSFPDGTPTQLEISCQSATAPSKSRFLLPSISRNCSIGEISDRRINRALTFRFSKKDTAPTSIAIQAITERNSASFISIRNALCVITDRFSDCSQIEKSIKNSSNHSSSSRKSPDPAAHRPKLTANLMLPRCRMRLNSSYACSASRSSSYVSCRVCKRRN